MGCIQSTAKKDAASRGTLSGGQKEDNEGKIDLLFKAKRHKNVFSAGVSEASQQNFKPKYISKSEQQKQTIRRALENNFVFSDLSEEDKVNMVNAMEIMNIKAGECVITQGEQGDYFYIVERGQFSVLVNGSSVGTKSEGSSFGELALLYDTPRAATVRSDTGSILYALDRTTFRFILAKSSASRSSEIVSALSKVPLLKDLTDDQLAKVADCVEIVRLKKDEKIFRKGEEGKIFYIIKEGTVYLSDIGVNSQFSNHNLEAGQYFGERALMTGEPRAANAVTLTPVTLLTLSATDFITLLGPLREVLDHNMNMRVLENIKLFSKLSKAEKDKVISNFSFETYSSGVAIIREGEVGNKFYILKEGTAKVSVDGVEVAELQTGTYFGEMALLEDDVRKATVTAFTNCECFVLDRATLKSILEFAKDEIERQSEMRLKGTQDRKDQANAQLSIDFGDLSTLAMLGSGTFGRVTLVQHTKTGGIYALKAMIKSEIVAHKQMTNVIQEKNVMMQSFHPFILRLYTTFKDSRRIYMLLEFVQGGELFSVLHTPTSDGVPDKQAKFYGAGVLLAIAYLHSKEIAYRDMKPENCLIDKDGYPKVVDFGFAKVISGKSYTLCGTPEYLAPELVLGRGHNKAVDYWAFGILLFEMQAGYSPFADQNGMDQVVICRNIVNGKLVFPKDFNSDCRECVKKLLSRDPTSRLGNLRAGTDEIKSQKWFQTFDFDKMLNRQMPAPWVPACKGDTDTSNFDPFDDEDPGDNAPIIDTSSWDSSF